MSQKPSTIDTIPVYKDVLSTLWGILRFLALWVALMVAYSIPVIGADYLTGNVWAGVGVEVLIFAVLVVAFMVKTKRTIRAARAESAAWAAELRQKHGTDMANITGKPYVYQGVTYLPKSESAA